MSKKHGFFVSVITLGLFLNSGMSYAIDVYARSTVAQTPLANSGGTLTTILSVQIPAGTWKATAKSSIVNFGTEDYVRCFISSTTSGGSRTQVDSAATIVGAGSGHPAVATIANFGVITTTSTTTFRLECLHDFAKAGEYVDPDAKLIVERISSGLSKL